MHRICIEYEKKKTVQFCLINDKIFKMYNIKKPADGKIGFEMGKWLMTKNCSGENCI